MNRGQRTTAGLLALVAAVGSCIRISAAQPDVPGFIVEVYAELCEPVRITLDEAGFLYAGNGGCAGSIGGPAWVRQISPGGSPIGNYGNSMINDPDSVLTDPTGAVTGQPGTVLVGGAGVFAILPDESVVLAVAHGGLVGNVSDMRLDSTGRLLILNLNPGRVAVSEGGAPVTELLALPAVGESITVDADDRIYTAAADGVIRIHNLDGSLLDGLFVTGLGSPAALAFGPGGPWGHYLYATSNGDLLRIDGDGNAQVIGTGIHPLARDLEFGPDGSLYISEDTNRILRISVDCPADADGNATVDIGDLLLVLAQWGPCPPECLGDVDGDGEVGVPDLLIVLGNWGSCQ